MRKTRRSEKFSEWVYEEKIGVAPISTIYQLYVNGKPSNAFITTYTWHGKKGIYPFGEEWIRFKKGKTDKEFKTFRDLNRFLRSRRMPTFHLV
jgi:hypothetical protein